MRESNLISVSGRIGHGKDLVGLISQYLIHNNEINSKIGYDYSISSFLSDLSNDKNFKIENSEYQVKKFADKLKDIICILIGCTRDMLEDRTFKEKTLGEDWVVYKLNGEIFTTLEEAETKLYDSYCIHRDNIYYAKLLEKIKKVELTPRLLLQLVGTECFRKIIHPNTWVNSTFSDFNKETSKWIITDTRFPNELVAIKNKGGITIRVIRHKDVIKLADEHESESALDNEIFDYTIINDGSIEDLIKKVKEILIDEKFI